MSPHSPIVSDDDQKSVLVTKEGLKKLQGELDHLINVRRKEVAERLKEAISYGDLSENSEYDAAKNEQAFVEGRIRELEDQVNHASLIDEKHKGAVVQLGSKVVIRNMSNNKEDEYTIVGSTEADALTHRLSNESPVGQALLDRKVDDSIDVKAPGGVYQYKIVALS
jgi:transcription elongation factor GreA